MLCWMSMLYDVQQTGTITKTEQVYWLFHKQLTLLGKVTLCYLTEL